MNEFILNYRFIQYAIYVAILVSILCGIIGVIIVEKKMVMMSGGIAHTSYGGVGLAYLLNIEPLFGAFVFSLIAAINIGLIKGKNKDIIIGLFWSLGMALGVIFVALKPGYPINLNTILFGSILSVTTIELILILILTIITLAMIILFYNHWMIYLFDEELAKVKKINVTLLKYVLLILIAFCIVGLIKVVGIILVMALLCAPAATANFFVRKFKNRMILASILGFIYCIIGLIVSYYVNISSGATIGVISVLAYFLVYLIMKRRRISFE